MSGVAGVFHRDGSAVDAPVIGRMLRSMHARAPDGDQMLCEGPVGIGLAFLRTGNSGAEAPGHLTLDRRVWIAGDVRLDARAGLLRELRGAGRALSDDTPHSELVLHAYALFGERFLEHLIGDFAFALWDTDRHQLVCARDHFGVRPFYYSHAGAAFAFASDIDALLAHPQVNRQLDNRSIGDFLLLGMCLDADQTIYQHVRCLPPATRMDVTRQGMTQRPFWSLPQPREIRYRTRTQYVEHFSEVFEQAVGDRLPAGPVALQLSGGMDSTAIAAVAASRGKLAAHPVTAYHLSFNSVEPQDDEGVFARMVANRLGIPMVSQDLGRCPLFARSQDPQLRTAFPLSAPHLAVHHDTVTHINQAGGRVLLSGYGGDAAMLPAPGYYTGLLHRGRLVKFARELGHHLRHARTLRGMGLRSALPPEPAPPPWKPAMPDWIDPDFIDHLALQTRWDGWWSRHESAADASAQLSLPWLHRQFEAMEILKLPLVGRYPFLDLRLVEFLLGLPNFMRADKAVLREAMRDHLPDAVTTRPKTGAPGDLVRTMAATGELTQGPGCSLNLPGVVAAAQFIAAWEKYLGGAGSDSTWLSWLILQPLALEKWLSQPKETGHG